MIAELEKQMRERDLLAVNIQFSGEGFKVHVRQSQSGGFVCAQRSHSTLAEALDEHFGPKNDFDLDDLLV